MANADIRQLEMDGSVFYPQTDINGLVNNGEFAIDDEPMAGSNNLITSNAVYDSNVNIKQMGGNIIGSYKKGKNKDYYYNSSLNLVHIPNNNITSCFIICNHQQLKLKYTGTGNWGIPSCIFVRNINNKIVVSLGDRTSGEHIYDLSSFDAIYLNFGDYLDSNGYEIIPKDEYNFNYKELQSVNGISISEIGDRLGYISVSNNYVAVNNLSEHTYMLLNKSVFDELKITEIYANITDHEYQLPCIIQTNDDGLVLKQELGTLGKHIISLHEDATKIYLNYFHYQYTSWHNIYRVMSSNDNLLDFQVNNYLIGTYYRRSSSDILNGMVNGDGTISDIPTFKYIKISGSYIKSIRYIQTKKPGVPFIITEKDGVFDKIVPSDNDGEIKYNLNYNFDYIYINFFDGTYHNDELGFLLYNDLNHNYNPSVTLDNVLNKPYTFNNKLAWFFGDSITAGYCTVNGVLKIITNGYPKQFSDAVGLNFSNKGVGGESICPINREGNDTLSHVITAFENASTLPDYIFIAGGSNDYAGNVNISDFKDAVENLFNYLSQNYTGEVIILTPINRIERSMYFSLQLNQYREVLTKYAIKHKFSVVDGSKFAFPTMKDGLYPYLLSDDAHPTENGYYYYAKMLRTVLY